MRYRAAAGTSTAAAGLGRPGGPLGARDPATASKAADAPAGHARYRPPLAPPPRHP